MTKRSQSWEAVKTLNCESVATKNYWYTSDGKFLKAPTLTTPHLQSILGFLYRRANYKRQVAIDVMSSPISKWKTPYYDYIARMSIREYCVEHFPTYDRLHKELCDRDYEAVPTAAECGLNWNSPYPLSQQTLSYDYETNIESPYAKRHRLVTQLEKKATILDKIESLLGEAKLLK